MTKAISCEQSKPVSELNALAPMRVGGLAHAIIDHAEDPAKVRELAQEIVDLEPDLLAMLIERAEATPELT